MKIHALAVVALLSVIAACDVLSADRTDVRSEGFPWVMIECRGELTLGIQDCMAWGDKVLAGSRDIRAGATRLLMTSRAGPNARCAADFFDGSGRTIATMAAVCPGR